MSKEISNTNNFLLYTNDDGEVKVEVFVKDETIWLTINQMAELLGMDKSGISRHVKNIFETDELQEEATVAKIATVQKEGNRQVTRTFGKDYFDELLEQIRDIRSSEKRFYRKITDIYSLAVDYSPKAPKEQQKIANCLSTLNDLIAAQAEKIEVLKAHKKGLMQGMFPNLNPGRL